MRELVVLISLFWSVSTFSQSFIILKGGEQRDFDSIELVREKYEKPYLKTNGGEIYRMEQIESFQNSDGFYVNNELTKNKNDFAERVLHGRVSIYKYDLSGNFIQNGQSSEREYYAYQKYDEPMKQMIYNNMIRDLSDNLLAMNKLNKIKRAKKITPLYYILGGASLITSAVLFNTDGGNLVTPFFIGGIGFFSIPWILNSQRQRRMDDAVRIYNAD